MKNKVGHIFLRCFYKNLQIAGRQLLDVTYLSKIPISFMAQSSLKMFIAENAYKDFFQNRLYSKVALDI